MYFTRQIKFFRAGRSPRKAVGKYAKSEKEFHEIVVCMRALGIPCSLPRSTRAVRPGRTWICCTCHSYIQNRISLTIIHFSDRISALLSRDSARRALNKRWFCRKNFSNFESLLYLEKVFKLFRSLGSLIIFPGINFIGRNSNFSTRRKKTLRKVLIFMAYEKFSANESD